MRQNPDEPYGFKFFGRLLGEILAALSVQSDVILRCHLKSLPVR